METAERSGVPAAQKESDAAIEACIKEAESTTSAEIRVLIAQHERTMTPAEVEMEAARHFVRLGMTRTPLRNGLLLFVAPSLGHIAVAADESIRLRLGARIRATIQRAAEPHLPQYPERAAQAAIRAASKFLTKYFPLSCVDRNDFPDDVIRC
jgi:uncharacterized membrane protein